MLHKTNPIMDDDRVQRFVEIQRTLIEFLCHDNNPLLDRTDPDLGQNIDNICDDKRFAKWIKDNETLQEQLIPIIDYLENNPHSRKELSDAFNHDFDYYINVHSNAYEFKFAQLNENLRAAITLTMKYLYEKRLGVSGYPRYLMGDGASFDRAEFIKLWEKENKTLNVCPACDGKKPDVRNGKRLSDLDHFLPKSIYPFLALHPLNLVPICIECNQRIKSDTDPINDNGSISLVNAFLPYGKNSAVDFIDVAYKRNPNGIFHLELVTNDPVQIIRMVSLDRVFGLEERWSSRIDEIKKEVVDSLREAKYGYQKIIQYEAIESEQYLQDVLEGSKDNTEVGSRQNRIIYRSYLIYALEDEIEFDELNVLFIS